MMDAQYVGIGKGDEKKETDTDTERDRDRDRGRERVEKGDIGTAPNNKRNDTCTHTFYYCITVRNSKWRRSRGKIIIIKKAEPNSDDDEKNAREHLNMASILLKVEYLCVVCTKLFYMCGESIPAAATRRCSHRGRRRRRTTSSEMIFTSVQCHSI